MMKTLKNRKFNTYWPTLLNTHKFSLPSSHTHTHSVRRKITYTGENTQQVYGRVEQVDFVITHGSSSLGDVKTLTDAWRWGILTHAQTDLRTHTPHLVCILQCVYDPRPRTLGSSSVCGAFWAWRVQYSMSCLKRQSKIYNGPTKLSTISSSEVELRSKLTKWRTNKIFVCSLSAMG